MEKLVQYQQVHDVCEKLLTEGRKISTRAVYSEIGQGNMSTILKYYQQWRKERSFKTEPQSTSLVSASLIQLLDKELRQIIDYNTKQATERATELREREEEATEMLIKTEGELEELREKNKSLKQLHEKNSELLEKSNKECSELKAIKEQYHTQLIELKALAAEWTDRNKKLTEQLQEKDKALSEVTKEKEELRKNKELLQNQNIELKIRVDDLKQQNQDTSKRLQTEEAHCSSLRKELEEAIAKYRERDVRLEEWMNNKKTLQEQLNASHEENIRLRTDCNQWQQQVVGLLQKQLDEQKAPRVQ
ncbi:MAG: DNA-binding protein [Oligoflexia bacterium]|nr:DNA-binding protein [Oligoflexia bacterium]